MQYGDFQEISKNSGGWESRVVACLILMLKKCFSASLMHTLAILCVQASTPCNISTL